MIKQILSFLIVLTLSFQGSVHAEPIRGLDLLGVAMMRAEVVAKEIDPNSALGFLDVTFGDPYPKLKKILDTGKIVAVRGHLGDGTVNGHICSNDERNLALLSPRAKKFAAFMSQYPNIKQYISPWLEHGCADPKLVNSWYDQLRKDAPQATLVCSAFRGYCPPNVLKDIHGNTGQGDVTSNDGASLFDADSVQYRNSGKVLTLGWTNCMNGRVTGEKSAPLVPIKRVDWCEEGDIKQAVKLMREPQAKPSVPGCVDISQKEILKTNAEYYGKGKDDGRGNKPMFITKNIYKRLSIQNLKGKEVGCMNYYGPFIDGRQRHYVGNCSKQTPIQLMDALGSEWGLMKAGKQCWYYNAIRREGSFH